MSGTPPLPRGCSHTASHGSGYIFHLARRGRPWSGGEADCGHFREFGVLPRGMLGSPGNDGEAHPVTPGVGQPTWSSRTTVNALWFASIRTVSTACP
jgi:hypothetical protein